MRKKSNCFKRHWIAMFGVPLLFQLTVFKAEFCSIYPLFNFWKCFCLPDVETLTRYSTKLTSKLDSTILQETIKSGNSHIILFLPLIVFLSIYQSSCLSCRLSDMQAFWHAGCLTCRLSVNLAIRQSGFLTIRLHVNQAVYQSGSLSTLLGLMAATTLGSIQFLQGQL